MEYALQRGIVMGSAMGKQQLTSVVYVVVAEQLVLVQIVPRTKLKIVLANAMVQPSWIRAEFVTGMESLVLDAWILLHVISVLNARSTPRNRVNMRLKNTAMLPSIAMVNAWILTVLVSVWDLLSVINVGYVMEMGVHAVQTAA
jgi:hypothetical protein